MRNDASARVIKISEFGDQTINDFISAYPTTTLAVSFDQCIFYLISCFDLYLVIRCYAIHCILKSF